MKRLLLCLVFLSATAFADENNFNIRIDPIGLLIGSIGLGLDFKLAPEWTLGPLLEYRHYTLSDDSSYFTDKYHLDAWAVALRANWFKNGVFTSGLYVGPSLNFGRASVRTRDLAGDSVSGSISTSFFEAIVGYGWFWRHFNIMLGVGGIIDLGKSSIDVHDVSGSHSIDTDITGLALEFSLGYAF